MTDSEKGISDKIKDAFSRASAKFKRNGNNKTHFTKIKFKKFSKISLGHWQNSAGMTKNSSRNMKKSWQMPSTKKKTCCRRN